MCTRETVGGVSANREISRNYARPLRLFVDTADRGEIERAAPRGIFCGVTTNPVLVAQEDSDYIGHLRHLLTVLPDDWELSAMVKGENRAEMLMSATILYELDPRIRIKVPAISEGLSAISELLQSRTDVKINITCVLSAIQALFALCLGNQDFPPDIVVSVFCDRQRVLGLDWRHTLAEAARLVPRQCLLACSLKTPDDLWQAAACGAGILTAPLAVYEKALRVTVAQEDVTAMASPFSDGRLKWDLLG